MSAAPGLIWQFVTGPAPAQQFRFGLSRRSRSGHVLGHPPSRQRTLGWPIECARAGQSPDCPDVTSTTSGGRWSSIRPNPSRTIRYWSGASAHVYGIRAFDPSVRRVLWRHTDRHHSGRRTHTSGRECGAHLKVGSSHSLSEKVVVNVESIPLSGRPANGRRRCHTATFARGLEESSN